MAQMPQSRLRTCIRSLLSVTTRTVLRGVSPALLLRIDVPTGFAQKTPRSTKRVAGFSILKRSVQFFCPYGPPSEYPSQHASVSSREPKPVFCERHLVSYPGALPLFSERL